MNIEYVKVEVLLPEAYIETIRNKVKLHSVGVFFHLLLNVSLNESGI
ncbi:MAG: hypothetical protein ACFWT6_00780 [Virgibacillus proomii]|jgi:hypothetical protein